MLMQTARTVLIAGGGIAGLSLATRLGHSLGRTGKARIVLVDRSPTHVWKPMLHTFAAGTWNVHSSNCTFWRMHGSIISSTPQARSMRWIRRAADSGRRRWKSTATH
jgi:2-polyprenyl-6-methoxyphenol hydroxylase-like FAD-dependent oxidoreductase